MTQPTRHVRSRRAGARLPEGVVVVTRPTKWGNPFKTAAEYTVWLATTPEGRAIVEAARRELRGKSLACWCPIGAACHADVLMGAANAPDREARL